MKPGLMVAGATIPMTSFSTHSATWITSIDSPVIVIHYRYSRQQYQQTNPSQLNPSPLLKEMPPARRRGGNTTANQPTLSFGSQARVTKPSATPTVPQKAKELEPATSAIPEKPSNDVAEPEQAPVTPAEPSKPHVAELAVRGQAKVETQQPWGEEDKKALEVSETDLQQYWKEEEGKRKAPRGWYMHILCSGDKADLLSSPSGRYHAS